MGAFVYTALEANVGDPIHPFFDLGPPTVPALYSTHPITPTSSYANVLMPTV